MGIPRVKNQILSGSGHNPKSGGGVLKEYHILIRIIWNLYSHLMYRRVAHNLAALNHVLDIGVMLMCLIFSLLPRDGGVGCYIGIHVFAVNLILSRLQCLKVRILKEIHGLGISAFNP